MFKIMEIFVIVFVLYCKINAEMDYLDDYKEQPAHSEEKIYTVKRRRDVDRVQRTTTRFSSTGQWERYLREGTRALNTAATTVIYGDAYYNDLDYSAVTNASNKDKMSAIDGNNTSNKKHKKKKKVLGHIRHNATEKYNNQQGIIATMDKKDEKYHEYEHRHEEKYKIVKNDTEYSAQPKKSQMSYAHENVFKNNHKQKRQGAERYEKAPFKVRKPWVRIQEDLFSQQALRSTRMMALYQSTDPTVMLNENQQEAANPHLYLSPYAIMSQMQQILEEKFPNANATFETLGRTVEYNNIVLVRITDRAEKSVFRVKEYKYTDDVPEKKIIFIVHGLSVMGMDRLGGLSQSSEFTMLLSYYLKHLDKFDFFLIPLANPDGYIATMTRSMWNKNMSPQSVCAGVALDRNFDVAWNFSNTSPCSQLFEGEHPFSEVETRAIRDVFHRFGHKIQAYIHVHPGTMDDGVFKGDAVLYPRGFSGMQTNDDVYIDIKADVDEAMKNASFRVMSVTVDTLHSWYGVVRGTSVDYAASVYGIPYAMEFVMQPYTKLYSKIALNEIWSRVIDNVFKNIWKNLNKGNDVIR